MKCLSYLFKLYYDSKLLLLQKCLANFNYIKPAQKSTSKSNLDTQYYNCSVLSTSFSTCLYCIYQIQSIENNKALNRFIPFSIR